MAANLLYREPILITREDTLLTESSFCLMNWEVFARRFFRVDRKADIFIHEASDSQSLCLFISDLRL